MGVRGRSWPNTTIDVQVEAGISIVGSLGVKQTDTRGYFDFAFATAHQAARHAL